MIKSLNEKKKKLESDIERERITHHESLQDLQESAEELRKIVKEFKTFVQVCIWLVVSFNLSLLYTFTTGHG